MVLSRNNDKSVSSKQGSTSTVSVTKAEASHNKKKSRKTYQLNRFLSKTFHLVNNSDRKIVAWAASEDSFIVFDVDEFAEKVLPQYFKHSKFSSFIRQLNFYGFRKIRADNDPLSQEIGMPYGSVRFFHPNFQPKRPDLLHKIHRATKTTSVSEEASSNDEEEEEPDQQLVESLQSQIDMLTEKLESAEERMDAKIGQIRESFESDYQRRISGLERAYHDLILSTLSPSSQLSLGRAPAGLGLPPPSSSALSSLLATSISGPALMALSAASGSGRRGGGSPLDSANRKYNVPSNLASFLR